MKCSVCNSNNNVRYHGLNLYCFNCINEKWCSHDVKHCCDCNYQNEKNLFEYDNRMYCKSCIDKINRNRLDINKCCICTQYESLELIDRKFYCNECATYHTKISKCFRCNVRHIKEVCIYDKRYDHRNSHYNFCSICSRNHLEPGNCKYCEECKDYVQLDFKHCGLCGDCADPRRNHSKI